MLLGVPYGSNKKLSTGLESFHVGRGIGLGLLHAFVFVLGKVLGIYK